MGEKMWDFGCMVDRELMGELTKIFRYIKLGQNAKKYFMTCLY